ncbi:MAG: hypothetical protein JXA74_07240 [Anaerolineae bacterium]|nr:hypothetical protein [Anaerolineae bacterium]
MSSLGKVKRFTGEWRATTLGSLPHREVSAAWQAILSRFPALPSWPQLPRKSRFENMYTQFSERFPAITLENESVVVDRRDVSRGLEQLYLAYLEDDVEYGRISAAYASALEALQTGEVTLPRTPVALKGQLTGPVSWALTVVDQHRRPILYDEVLLDAVGKHLRMKAAWQETVLRQFAPQTMIFLEEPYMASFGSSFVSLSRSQVIELIEEIVAPLQGLAGIHCCGNTDWSILLNTSIDILSLDAYDYTETLTQYASDVNQFLQRGGIIAWGIVPAGVAAESESVTSLVERLHAALDGLVDAGVSRDAIMTAGLVTPSCGLGSLTPPLAERILDLTRDVSTEMQRLYGASAPRRD